MLPRLAHHYALPSRFALASTPSCVLSLSASTCCVCRNLCTSFSSILCRPPLDLCPCPDAKPHLIGDGVSFPEIPMDLDQVYIKLRYKSSGYAPKVERVSIQPGANQIDLDLKAHND